MSVHGVMWVKSSTAGSEVSFTNNVALFLVSFVNMEVPIEDGTLLK